MRVGYVSILKTISGAPLLNSKITRIATATCTDSYLMVNNILILFFIHNIRQLYTSLYSDKASYILSYPNK